MNIANHRKIQLRAPEISDGAVESKISQPTLQVRAAQLKHQIALLQRSLNIDAIDLQNLVAISHFAVFARLKLEVPGIVRLDGIHGQIPCGQMQEEILRAIFQYE